MINKTTIIIITILITFIGVYFLLQNKYQISQESEIQTPSSQMPVPNNSIPETIVTPNNEESSVIKQINITSDNFSFSPNKIILKKNQPVKISFINLGTHTFTVDELGINAPLNGFSPIIEFTPTKSGTFKFYCAVPGHLEQGMVGTLIVEE